MKCSIGSKLNDLLICMLFYCCVKVHCHHCGKEVEIVAALDDTEHVDLVPDEEPANIVKPPADFADSPEGARQPQRLYKKLDRRLRSEERHGERKHYRSRQDSARAKVSGFFSFVDFIFRRINKYELCVRLFSERRAWQR